MTLVWPAARVKNFVKMYYKLYMRDGEDAMPLKVPRMTREDGIVFLCRRLNISCTEFETISPFVVARALFEPNTILYDTEKRMEDIYTQLFGKAMIYTLKAHVSEEVMASLSVVANSAC